MTVKCLTALEKYAIRDTFLFDSRPASKAITDLSYEYKVSRRTVIRVLEELGLDPQVRTRKATDAPAQSVIPMEAMEDPADPSPHEVVVQATALPIKNPWYRRLKEWLFGAAGMPQYQ